MALAIYNFMAPYGVAHTIVFAVESSVTNGQFYATAPSTFLQISKDGGAFTSTTNGWAAAAGLPTVVTLALTATEMQARRVTLAVDRGAFGGGSNLGIVITIDTFNCPWVRVATCQAGSSASTIKFDANASAVDNFYNEMQVRIVGGTGVGQQRTIVSYTGATTLATVSRNWTTTPDNTSVFAVGTGGDVWDQLEGTQPSGSYSSATGTFRRIAQFLIRRFYNKVTQNNTTQTVYKDDSSTVLTTMTCSADGTTQTKGVSS